MANASHALQASKENGGECVVFDDRLKSGKEYREGIEMKALVCEALDRKLVRPYVQEIVQNVPTLSVRLKKFWSKIATSFRSDHSVAKKAVTYERRFEMLARLIDPRDGITIIPPGRFLWAVEDRKKTKELTREVIDHALSLMLEHPKYAFSINLSPEDAVSPVTVEFVRSRIESYRVDPAMLIFEISEKLNPALFDAALSVVRGLKNLGCKIAIDDFGSGYSNYEILGKIKPDYLKIDRSCISEIDRDAHKRSLVASIVTYARANGILIVAEGMETEGEQRVVMELGVDYSQGFLFSRPTPTVS